MSSMRYGSAATLVALLCAQLAGQAPQYDVLISGGRVFDGSGNPWSYADVAVRGDAIAAVGPSLGGSARLRIDARRLAVAPGFIDIHTHARWGIFADPDAQNYVRQGVTTVMDGNDGDSPIPLRPFLDRLARTPIAVNFGTFAGQGTIRRSVTGLENRPATPAELNLMREEVRAAMLDGAFGLSTGLLYGPGSYTPTEEIVALARVAGNLGGIYISHIRDEAAGVAASVEEAIRIGAEAHLPVQVTHHKIVGAPNWGRSRETLRLIEEARARGIDVTLDQYPYTASSTETGVLLPQWSLAGGQTALAKRLADPADRARIKAGVILRLENGRGGGDPKNVVLTECPFDKSLNGKSLAEIVATRGRTATPDNAAEAVVDIERHGGCAAVFHAMNEEDVERIMASPLTMIASDGEIPVGDGVPHPRSYGTFARVLGRYVRERHLLTLEEAVRKMTSMPAGRFGLHDRGFLRPGMKADIVVFDPASVSDRATYREPRQFATGFEDVLVNGTPVILHGTQTKERPGRVLYGPAH